MVGGRGEYNRGRIEERIKRAEIPEFIILGNLK